MENLFIGDLNTKDVEHFTTNLGLYIRKISDVPFKKMCNIFTHANIIKIDHPYEISDEEYFNSLDIKKKSISNYPLQSDKNNIVLERYPQLEQNEPYIFVANHTCPEDIETILNIIDRNAYLVLGSIESLKYNPEMYLLWLNGMIPFDIINEIERKELLPKMERVIQTNSILIFPEGSHNYHPNKIINNLFDGPINLSLNTGRKIVVITMLKDYENNVSYIDVSNPLDVSNLNINIKDYYPHAEQNTKYYVKALSSYLRDKMATAAYYMMERHFNSIQRSNYQDIDHYFKSKHIEQAFSQLKWQHDVFEAEYKVKKSQEERDYEEVIYTLSNLSLNSRTLRNTQLTKRDYVLKSIDLDNKNVARYMRDYWNNNYNNCENSKVFIKK